MLAIDKIRFKHYITHQQIFTLKKTLKSIIANYQQHPTRSWTLFKTLHLQDICLKYQPNYGRDDWTVVMNILKYLTRKGGLKCNLNFEKNERGFMLTKIEINHRNFGKMNIIIVLNILIINN